MKWRKNLYFVHRWTALLVSLQLLAWSVGGFTFSILDLDNVHGDWERSMAEPESIRLDRVHLTPQEVLNEAAAGGLDMEKVVVLSLRRRLHTTVYELYGAEDRALGVVDAHTGQFSRRISPEQAKSAALADFEPQAGVASVTLLEGDPPLEYRGKPMPVYQVVLDHPKNPHLYVSPVTGEIITRRNKPWRIFDFFWMLHIMDYRERDDFNHWLLTGMSSLAILTSVSGLLLWWLRFPRLAKRQA